MNRKIRIIKGFQGSKEGALCFMTNSSSNNFSFTFDDVKGTTALRLFYERICLGASFPSCFILNELLTPNHAFGAALFTDPSLVLEDECLALVSSFDLYHRWADVSCAHINPTHLKIINALEDLLSSSKSETETDLLRKIGMASTLIESYLKFGDIPLSPDTPEQGSFTLLEEEGPLAMFHSPTPLWGEFYSHGFLCGIWVKSPPPHENLRPLIFKKSSLVSHDLNQLGRALNKKEFGLTGNSSQGLGWLSCKDPNLLVCPSTHPETGDELKGTSLTTKEIWNLALDVLIRKEK